jgi:hypothetical protein
MGSAVLNAIKHDAASGPALLSSTKAETLAAHEADKAATRKHLVDRKRAFEKKTPDVDMSERPKRKFDFDMQTAKIEAGLAELEAKTFDDHVFVVYPDLAKAIDPAFATIAVGRVDGKFSKLSVQHDGRDVFVYWPYDALDVAEHWTFAPRSILNSPGYRPMYPEKLDGHPDLKVA